MNHSRKCFYSINVEKSIIQLHPLRQRLSVSYYEINEISWLVYTEYMPMNVQVLSSIACMSCMLRPKRGDAAPVARPLPTP